MLVSLKSGNDGKQDTFKTFKPIKDSSFGSSSNKLAVTLGKLERDNLKAAVSQPIGININEWLVMNLLSFFNDLSMIYGLLTSECDLSIYGPGEGFPPGFEYRWATKGGRKSLTFSGGGSSGRNDKKTVSVVACSGPEYVSHVMDWVDNEIDTFPEDNDILARYTSEFKDVTMADIFKRLFRVYAIIVCCHKDEAEKYGIAPHLNTALKHFLFFIFEHSFLISDEREFLPIEKTVAAFRELYHKDDEASDSVAEKENDHKQVVSSCR